MADRRLIVFAVDAAELSIVRRGIDEGWLPTLAGLAKAGASAVVDGNARFPGATWPTTITGTPPESHRMIMDRLLEPGTTRQSVVPREMIRRPPFWRHAAGAGLAPLVVNVYGMPLLGDIDAVQVAGWSASPDPTRTYIGGPASVPPETVRQLERELGSIEQPLRRPAHSAGDWRAFRAAVADGTKRFAEGVHRLAGKHRWRMLIVAPSELHTVGHYAWHLGDPDHPKHDPSMPDDVRRIYQVAYADVDAGIARILEHRTPDDTVVVFTPHGMRRSALLSDPAGEVLRRAGLLVRRHGPGTASGDRGRWLLRKAWDAARHVTP